MAMDVVDYEIKGAEMQFVEVELDPGEAAVGEAGAMMYMDNGIVLDTVFGDGSQQNSGLWGALVGAGKRLISGANVFTTVFMNQSNQKRRIAFATPVPGKILLNSSTPPWVRAELKKMGYAATFEERTSGPVNAIMIDRAHATFWGASSNHGEDYGIGW